MHKLKSVLENDTHEVVVVWNFEILTNRTIPAIRLTAEL